MSAQAESPTPEVVFDWLWSRRRLDPDGAASWLDTWRAANPFDASLIGFDAMFHAADGDRAAATRLVDEALSLDDNDLFALRAEVMANCSEEYAEVATARATAALDAYPNDLWLLQLAVRAALLSGQADGARQWIDVALRQHGDEPAVLALAGEVELAFGTPDGAERLVRAALALVDSDNAPVRWREQLAVALHRQARHDEALDVLQEGPISQARRGASAQLAVYRRFGVYAALVVVSGVIASIADIAWLKWAMVAAAGATAFECQLRYRQMEPTAREAFLARELAPFRDDGWRGTFLRWFFAVAGACVLAVSLWRIAAR
jgi:tetratricopeptide (TPR) repeat protein